MKYRIFKSRNQRYGVPLFYDGQGNSRSPEFTKHTLVVPIDDTDLIAHIEGIIEKEKNSGKQRNIFLPEEFAEMTQAADAFFEHSTEGKIPHSEVAKMINYAIEHGYKSEETANKIETGHTVNVSQGTATAGKHDKSGQSAETQKQGKTADEVFAGKKK